MRLILSFVRHCIDNNLVPSRIDNALTRMNRRTIHVHTNIFIYNITSFSSTSNSSASSFVVLQILIVRFPPDTIIPLCARISYNEPSKFSPSKNAYFCENLVSSIITGLPSDIRNLFILITFPLILNQNF